MMLRCGLATAENNKAKLSKGDDKYQLINKLMRAQSIYFPCSINIFLNVTAIMVIGVCARFFRARRHAG